MTLIWGDFRTIIQRTLLNTTGLAPKVTSEMLRDGVGFALNAFCSHTAAATSIEYVGDATTKIFTLPGNVYKDVDEAGLVYETTAEGTISYLIPVLKTPDALFTDTLGFYSWNMNQLICTVAPGSGVKLKVLYYAYFNKPVSDSDTIDVPAWGQTALAYWTGIHVLSALSAQEANQEQFNQRPDTGTPQQNALRAIQEQWLKVVEIEMRRHPVQDRRYLYRRREDTR